MKADRITPVKENTIVTTQETITPAMASLYRRSSPFNRPINHLWVKMLADAMRSGQWNLTHQGICFDGEGRLVDGNHRLEAVIDSGCTVQMMVSRGANSESVGWMDCGRIRTASDAAVYSDTDATKYDLSLARSFVLGGYQRFQGRLLMAHEVGMVFELFKREIKFANSVIPNGRRGMAGLQGTPVRAPLARAACTEDHARLRRFATILTDGVPPSETNEPGDISAFALRSFLTGTAKPERIASYYNTQRAIRAFLDGDDLQKLGAIKKNREYWPLDLEKLKTALPWVKAANDDYDDA